MGILESPRARGWSSRVGPAGKAARQSSLGSSGPQGGLRKSTYTGPETDEERARRRAKNRIAARESRARKLQCIMSLQADIAALQETNVMLRSRIDEITAKAEEAQRQHQMMKEQIFMIRASRSQEDQLIIDDLLGGMQATEACGAGGASAGPTPSISDLSPGYKADPGAETNSCQASMRLELRLHSAQMASPIFHVHDSSPTLHSAQMPSPNLGGHAPSPPQLIGSPFHPLHVAADEAFLGMHFQ